MSAAPGRKHFFRNAEAAIYVLPIVHDPNVARRSDGKIGLHLQTSADIAAGWRNLVTRLHPWRAILCTDAAKLRTVEQTRRLVESDDVALIFSSLGTAQNNAIAKYLQTKNVPQLFLASGSTKFGDISQFPKALMGIQAPFRIEARLYARHAVEKLKGTKIAVLAQNDDFGRDYLAGLRDVLESRFEQVVSVATYEVTDGFRLAMRPS